MLADYVKLRAVFNHPQKNREESWLTKRNARTLPAHVRRRKAESIAALHAKAPATRSNWTVIAVTKSVREISK
jgi:hypothetical protein